MCGCLPILSCACHPERTVYHRPLPADKAIDLLDEACACCNLAHPVISEFLTMQKELEALKQEEADMENADVNEPIDYERVAERKTRWHSWSRTARQQLAWPKSR